MSTSAYISLKSGRQIDIDNFKYITYPSNVDSKSITKVETFDNFYLYDKLLTFVGESDILTLKSSEIEFIKFYNVSSN
ncbi:MAG: hypothetical protein E6344_18075 [Clostridium sp.]|nr:hypothetical protein [Clostridium sp.]MDU7085605.1 hypothetical protein [Clostridium sp.]